MKKLVWGSKNAGYRFFNITFNVDESRAFELKEDHGVCALCHHNWGNIKNPAIDWFVEIFFKYIFRRERKNYQHRPGELQYVNNDIES